MNGRILPEKYRVFSGSMLKLIAIVCMAIDHAGVMFQPDHILLFTVFGTKITLYALMRFVGRIAFPIFAFLIAEGYRHTRSKVRYGVSLLVFALLSEVPWDLFRFGVWFSMSKQNVFFTLLLGYLAICAYEKLKERRVLQVGSVLLLLAASYLMRADYGMVGFCTIILMYALREHELLRDVIGIAALSAGWRAAIAFVPLAFYNEKRGFIKGMVWKYAFYLFYPLHLLALYFIKILFS